MSRNDILLIIQEHTKHSPASPLSVPAMHNTRTVTRAQPQAPATAARRPIAAAPPKIGPWQPLSSLPSSRVAMSSSDSAPSASARANTVTRQQSFSGAQALQDALALDGRQVAKQLVACAPLADRQWRTSNELLRRACAGRPHARVRALTCGPAARAASDARHHGGGGQRITCSSTTLRIYSTNLVRPSMQ